MTRLPTGQETIAETNMERLRENPMPGDGIAMGITENGELALQVVWLASDSSRLQDRVLTPAKASSGAVPEGAIRVAFRDDPTGAEAGRTWRDAPKDNLTFPAMLATGGFHAVANGMQISGVLRSASNPRTMMGGAAQEMLRWDPYRATGQEPDERTPRIAGVMRPMVDGRTWYSLAVSRMATDGGVEHVSYDGNFAKNFRGGVVRGIATAAFERPERGASAALILPVAETVEDTLEMYGEALASDKLSALAVKGIDIATGEETGVTIANKPGPDVSPSSFTNRFFV